MAMLVLLNGPPASGKSTVARRLVAARPLALCLDVDVVRGLLGEWLDFPSEAGRAARALAIAMARTHLLSERDVIIPQFLGRVEFIEELERLAAETGSTFVEIALEVDRDHAREAFARRSAASGEPAHADAAALIARSPSPDPLGDMIDRYEHLLERRSNARRVEVVWNDVDATVRHVEDSLVPGVEIRTETPLDHVEIADVVTRAFGSPAEARLVDAIRASPGYLPELALVAVFEGRIVGHVMIGRCTVIEDSAVAKRHPAVMLSPLAVDPSVHRGGIGGRLVREVTERAAAAGHPFVVLEGDPGYYSRFGFEPASAYGLRLPLPDWAPPEAAQVLRLGPDEPIPQGRVVYPSSFDVLEDG